MEHSHQQIHLSPDVLLDIFKFLLGSSLRKCQMVTSQWSHIIRGNKHLLCTADQMNTALFACLKCVKRRHSDEEYQEFCEAIRNLLLSDCYEVDKKS
uniref:F-box domain-containing protein n=1 Tax=Ditylenchus dipsaci TaxID=166011 RepID=A0A915DI10_9BILA